MSGTEKIVCNKLIITNDKGIGSIDIVPGKGNTLNFPLTSEIASGIEGSIQFNKDGEMFGNEDIIYSEADLRLTVENVRTGLIDKALSSNAFDYNEIYRPDLYTPELLQTAVTSLGLFATDVSLSRNTNYLSACSRLFLSGTKGGTTIWNKPASDFVETVRLEVFNIFGGVDTNTDTTALNEDASFCTISALALFKISIYTRSGASWISPTEILDCMNARISGNRIFTVSNSNVFKVYFFNGSTWILESVVLSGIGSWSDTPMAMPNDSTVIFFYNGAIRIYTRSGTTWTLQENITLAGVTSIDAYSGILSVCMPGQIKIYETYNTLVSTIAIASVVHTTTNGTYVFVSAYSTDKIYIVSKILGIWTQSVNSTYCLRPQKMSCNANNLCVGAPLNGFGVATMYDIIPYTPFGISINNINLDDSGNISMTSLNGQVNINSSLDVSDVLNSDTFICAQGITCGSLVSNGVISCDGGNVGAPGLSFSADSGVYNSVSNDISFKVGSGNTSGTFTSGGLVMPTGKFIYCPGATTGSPSYTFDGFTTTGISRPFGNTTMAFSTGGVPVFYIAPDQIVAAVPVRVQNGSASAPTLTFENKNNTGFYNSDLGNNIMTTVNGSRTIIFDSLGITCDNNNNRILSGQGSVTAPALSFLGKSTTGFWSAGTGISTELDLSVQGVNMAAFRYGSTYYNTSMQIQVASLNRFFVRAAGGSDSSTSVYVYAGEGFLTFYHYEGVVKGSVSTNGLSVFYNTTSSRSLKKNIEPMCEGICLIRQLKPCKYNWIDDKRINPDKSYGFIADEMKEVIPEIVTDRQEKVNDDGSITYVPEMIDYSKIIPVLTCAIKYLDSENEALKARVLELEDRLALFEARLLKVEDI